MCVCLCQGLEVFESPHNISTVMQKQVGIEKLDDLGQSDSRRYFRIYKTVLQIMEARGYVVADELSKMGFIEFNDHYERHDLNEKVEIFPPLDMEDTDDYDPSIAVIFNFANEAITEEFIKRMIQAAPKIRRFFVVAPNNDRQKPNAALLDKKAQNFINELGKKDRDEREGIRIEIFRQEDLLFNVLKHDLVPEHRVLSEEQKNVILQKYKVKESQLPKILLMDPVAKFLGLRRGQVVKIIRKSETAGTYTTYRIAI